MSGFFIDVTNVSLITFNFNLKLLSKVVYLVLFVSFDVIFHWYFSNCKVELNLCTKYFLDIQPKEAI